MSAPAKASMTRRHGHLFALPRTAWLLTLVSFCVPAASCGFNDVIEADETVKASWAEVDNQYKRRADLVPQLVATVKGAANFEKDTLTQIAQARARVGSTQLDANSINDPAKLKQFEQAQGQLSGALSRLMVVAEKYPELKATGGFRDLQAQLEGTENRIAVARRRFVESVAAYNKVVLLWPSAMGAKLRGKTVRPTFEAPTGSDAPPTVQF